MIIDTFSRLMKKSLMEKGKNNATNQQFRAWEGGGGEVVTPIRLSETNSNKPMSIRIARCTESIDEKYNEFYLFPMIKPDDCTRLCVLRVACQEDPRKCCGLLLSSWHRYTVKRGENCDDGRRKAKHASPFCTYSTPGPWYIQYR